MTLGDHQRRCLEVLTKYDDPDHCFYFRFVVAETGLSRIQVRRAVRALARKELAEYVRGLFDDDGMVAGSGYRCTPLGREFMQEES